MSSIIRQHTKTIKEAALRHGFMGAGIARAEHMPQEAKQLEQWLSKGYHGEMSYMANHFDLRTDPTKLVPGARSVISLQYNYFPQQDLAPPSKGAGGFSVAGRNTSPPKREPSTATEPPPKISRYAYGEDYHKVVRRKLKALVAELKSEIGDFNARVFVDSAPVMERDWAKRSGQGWIGKNTLLIHPKKGSYFFLAEIILDVELEYDPPMRDHCGTCTKCIDACPTEAISPEGFVLDGSKCISYLTIELKSHIPESFKGKMEDWIFGCDICQEVCPWNRFSTPHTEPAFEPSDQLREMKREDWLELTDEVFKDLFPKSAVKRAGLEKIRSSINFMELKKK